MDSITNNVRSISAVEDVFRKVLRQTGDVRKAQERSNKVLEIEQKVFTSYVKDKVKKLKSDADIREFLKWACIQTIAWENTEKRINTPGDSNYPTSGILKGVRKVVYVATLVLSLLLLLRLLNLL